jgi:hypothetical protein
MRYTIACERAFAVIVILVLSGCSTKPPARFNEGVSWVAAQHKVSDAKSQRVAGRPCLRMDVALLDRLDAVLKEDDDLTKAKADALALLDDAHGLALQAANNELKRLDEQGWRQLTKEYFGSSAEPTDSVKQQLAEEFRRQTDTQVWFIKHDVESSTDLKSLRAVLEPIQKNTAKSVKTEGGVARAGAMAVFALPAQAAQNSIHAKEESCQPDGKFDGRALYAPTAFAAETPAGFAPNDPELRNWEFLARFAPVFVQEAKSDINYPPSEDQLGSPTIEDDAGTVAVDVSQPAVYGYSRQVLLNGRPHMQLIYAIWYPSHPKLKEPVDPEAGHIDGATVRITLDSNRQPAVVETVNNCGCHHRVYVTQALEQAAADEYPAKVEGKLHSIEQDVSGKYDLIVGKLLNPQAGVAEGRVLVRCRAGTHAVVDVNYADRGAGAEPVVARHEYALRPYAELEQLPTPGGKVMSMFLDNGLVRGAERLEGAIFTPLGMLSAGQPRQRGTQLIQWDQYDFDDPRLLEKTLRLPRDF